MSSIEEIRKKVESSLSVSETMPEGAIELENIFSSLNSENSESSALFQGKYKVFLMKNILPWEIQPQNPLKTISNHFETVFVIVGAKLRERKNKFSGEVDEPLKNRGAAASTSETGIPAKFQPSTSTYPTKRFNFPPLPGFTLQKYIMYALSPSEIQKLFHICVSLSHKSRLMYPVVMFGKNEPKTAFIKGYYRTEAGKQLRFHVSNPGTILELFNVPYFGDEVALHCKGFKGKLPYQRVYDPEVLELYKRPEPIRPKRDPEVLTIEYIIEKFGPKKEEVKVKPKVKPPPRKITERRIPEPEDKDLISVSTDLFAHYHIPPMINGFDEPGDPSKYMNVDVECYWDTVGKLLQFPSVYAKFFVNMRCVDGDDLSGAFSKFKELKIISALRESLVTGLMKWSIKPKGFVLNQLETFMSDEKEALFKRPKAVPLKTTYTLFGNTVLYSRSNLDFVEKLWLILKDCPSSEELVEAFTYVYKILRAEFLEPPRVYSKSFSKLSLDIKSMREKNIEVPMLDSLTAVKMLLEIGTEKLRRDYDTLFCGFGLAPAESVSYFLQPPLLSPKSVLFLRMLHEVLEMTYICYKAFSFPEHHLQDFVRKLLEFYTSVDDIDLQHIFRFELPADVVFPMLKGLCPTTWEVSLVTSNEQVTKQTVLQFSKIPYPAHLAKGGRAYSRSYQDSAYVFTRSTLIEDDIFA